MSEPTAKPIIMFDFDGTFTSDIATFRAVVEIFKNANWTVLLITAREGTDDDKMLISKITRDAMPVLFTSGRPKRRVALENGYDVHIWVEDNPALVDFGFAGMELVEQFYPGTRK